MVSEMHIFVDKDNHFIMYTPKISFTTKEESKAESFRQDLEREPVERLRVFLQMSELYLNLYPPQEPKPDNNFHIYPDERR
jgi:hypothetical protein